MIKMKNILAENLLRFGVKNLKESDKEKLSEGLLLEADMPASTDYAAASKTWKASHKGNFNNLKGQTLTYAGATYFVCVNLPANPAGGTIMNQVSANCLQIKPNRYGVPLVYWAGSVWINDNGTASTVNSSTGDGAPGATYYPDVTTAWKGLTSNDIAAIKQYGAFGTNWTTYCTNQAAKVSAIPSVAKHVQANLEKYKTQPTGFASDLWLTIKPLVGA
jgi:hypothetical protein